VKQAERDEGRRDDGPTTADYQRSEKALVLSMLEMVAFRLAFQDLIWQGCQVHMMRNVLDQYAEPRGHEPMKRLLDGIFGADSPEATRTAFAAPVDKLDGHAEKALTIIKQGSEDAIAVLAAARE